MQSKRYYYKRDILPQIASLNDLMRIIDTILDTIINAIRPIIPNSICYCIQSFFFIYIHSYLLSSIKKIFEETYNKIHLPSLYFRKFTY